MRTLVHLGCRKGVRHAIAAMGCVLLLFFAVGAKLAWYHPHEAGAKRMAAMKAWQTTDSLVPSLDLVKVLPAPPALFAALFDEIPAADEPMERRNESLPIFLSSSGFSPFAVRPPPVC